MIDLELTDEEQTKVNEIISGIQSDLNEAISSIKKGDYISALNHVNNSITKSNCPLCKRQLGILIADITHTKTICPLDPDLCEAEKEELLNRATEVKDEFVPITTKKKAIKDKKSTKIPRPPMSLDELLQKILFPFKQPIKRSNHAKNT